MKLVICRSQIIISKNSDITLKIEGYQLPSKNHSFKVGDEVVRSITITNPELLHIFVKKMVFKKYNKLLEELTELFLDDDNQGGSMTEVLNKIERFRTSIKIKYRKYLKKAELEEMAKKLKFLQKQAQNKQIMLYYDYMNVENKKEINSRSR